MKAFLKTKLNALKSKALLKCESGATAIEYGLIAAAMGLALITVMPTLAGTITSKFTYLSDHIDSGQ